MSKPAAKAITAMGMGEDLLAGLIGMLATESSVEARLRPICSTVSGSSYWAGSTSS
eukprot:CAMPEP_0175657662 /NCGR_PEP_ID=MMETSP0097-20121207/13034_1 /TAXON_ID=311494 /ORGANISM="Alexandrium monilatum, Strain CCMP3105" /LENGTH=55 /DNA_ID=CAMNT_0016963761 /DNA_START=104 /DNA_END=267 /DNA_ORIENTATION=+